MLDCFSCLCIEYWYQAFLKATSEKKRQKLRYLKIQKGKVDYANQIIELTVEPFGTYELLKSIENQMAVDWMFGVFIALLVSKPFVSPVVVVNDIDEGKERCFHGSTF